MNLHDDVVWRTLTFTVSHHQGVPSHVTLYTTVSDNGDHKRQEELRIPLERAEDLGEILVSEADAFIVASGDNGVRSLFG